MWIFGVALLILLLASTGNLYVGSDRRKYNRAPIGILIRTRWK